ncbi:MAG: sugar phosphate isomerase/epimerase family protein [Saccharofermentanales bacterium]
MFKYSITAAFDMPARSPVILRGTMEQCAKKAVEAGYDALEMHLRNPSDLDGKMMKSIADKYEIGFSAIATGMEYTVNGFSLIDKNETARAKAVQRLKEHIDLAQVLDCAVIIGIMRSNIPDFMHYTEYENYLAQGLKELAGYAESKKVILVFEAITRYINNYLNNIPETTDFIKKIGSPNLLVHADSHSMNIEDRSIAESLEYCSELLGYVHFSDSNRMYPGAGHIDFKEYLRVLDAIGYKGYISLECLPLPDERTCCDNGLMYVKTLETILDCNK